MATEDKKPSQRSLAWIGGLVVCALIGWQLIQGATIQELGIPGLFTVKFGKKEPPPHTGAAQGGQTEEAQIFLSVTSGPAGSNIKISGEGFAPNERIVFNFHTTEIGDTHAGPNGSFSGVEVPVPDEYRKFAPKQFYVFAIGQSSNRSPSAKFMVSG